MSWILGALGKNGNRLDSEYLKSLHGKTLFNISTENFYIAAGENKNTCCYGELDIKWRWIVCGVSLDINNGTTEIYSASKWANVLSNKLFDTENINGHFAAVKWNNEEINLYTDYLGLRDFYLAESTKTIFFSTRIDLIAKVVKTDINLHTFGSRWLLFNQLSNESILTNTIRVNQGKSVLIKNGNLHINQPKKSLIQISSNTVPEHTFDSKIKDLLNIGSAHDKIVFALSGGLDSRLILSYLLRYQTGNFKTVTFGNKNQQDAIVTKKMADELCFEHELIYSDLPSSEKLVSEIEDAVNYWQVTNPVSAILNLRYYNNFTDKSIIIDGGFGEIWRLEFLKKLQLRGKRFISNRDYKNLSKILRYFRADIFNIESIAQMEEGVLNDLEEIFNVLPGVKNLGYINWIDTFSLQTRLANFYGPEQARVDDFTIAYMPFVQQFLINDLLKMNPGLRLNGKLFKQLIKENCNPLSKYPLVNGNITYPFGLSSIQKRIWSKLNPYVNKISMINDNVNLLLRIKEFVMDEVLSAEVNRYSFYDSRKISKLAEEFYAGNYKLVNQLDWFLSFELFRRNISKN